MHWRSHCVQCGRQGNGVDLECPELPDGTWDPNTRICRDKQACRERWFAEFSYKLDVG